MNAENLAVFLVTYLSFTSFGALLALALRFTPARLTASLIYLGALAASVVLATRAIPDTNFLEYLIGAFQARDLRALVATALGLGAASAWVLGMLSGVIGGREAEGAPAGRARGLFGDWPRQGFLAIGAVAVALLASSYAWNEIDRDWKILRTIEPGYSVEKVASFPYYPIRLAVGDDGRIFVSADRADNGFDLGYIYEVENGPGTGEGATHLAAESPALFRPYGLAYRDGDLYVARSGHLARARDGRISYDSAGFVTQLKDFDGDGRFEYLNDVVGDLPGSQGPDPQHQNNGILFDPEGNLYITQGNPANRAPSREPWCGTVLRRPAEGEASGPEIFARGLRNPYAMTIGPDGSIFVIDNDVDANPGDEINHLIEGEHYGHPFVIPEGREHEGFRDPIFLGPKESHLCGLAYADPSLPVGRLAGRLLVADPHMNRVLWVAVERAGDSYEATDHGVVAMIPSPVDVAVGPDGSIFILSRYSSSLYRLRPTGVDRPDGASP